MQLSIDELKSLIIWAKAQKVKVLEVSGIKVEFTELAFIDEVPGLSQDKTPSVPASSQSFTDDYKDEEDDDLLFHSARP